MFGIHDFALFVTTGILLNLTPGPDTLYILGRSIAQGRRAGVASALGISVGSVFHTGAAALGLSAVLATSAWAFTIVKLAGAAYLIFLGVRCSRAAISCRGPQIGGSSAPSLDDTNAGEAGTMKHRAAERAIHLPSSNDPHKFDAIAFREFSLGPFPLMKRGLVVLDQDAVRLQTELFRQVRDTR